MGVLDFIVRQIEAVGAVATAGQRAVQQLGEEAERKFLEITGIEQKERELKSKIEQTATALIEGLQSLAPRYEGKLQQMKDEVTEVAATAAGKGVDITKAVNAAVDIMLRKVEEALNSAFEAVNEFLEEAEKQLFEILQGLLPELLHGLLDPLRVKLREVVDVLKTLGKMIQDRILEFLDDIKVVVKDFVRKVDETLGPIWQFVKMVWKAVFGMEPEQCNMVAQWFGERMKRTEMQLLYQRSSKPVSALIRKHTYLELLPPDEHAWKAHVLGFFNRADSVPAWRIHGERMAPLLANRNPKPGTVVQLTWDEPFIDALGGLQRVQISVLYFRWRTEEFRRVSSGFLGILAMVCAAETQEKPYVQPASVQLQRGPALQIESVMRKKIYDKLAPHIRLRPMERHQPPQEAMEVKKGQSRQLKIRGDDGIWRTSV